MPHTHLSSELRELGILDELGQSARLSQRELARRLGISVGFLNRCLQALLEHGYIKVADRTVRPFAYRVTPAGEAHRQQLKYENYQAVVVSFLDVERRIQKRLKSVKRSGARRIAFYGAGEIMDLAQKCSQELGLEVVGAVDDDLTKQRTPRNGLLIQAPAALDELLPDAVLITTIRHARDIGQRMEVEPRQFAVWHL